MPRSSSCFATWVCRTSARSTCRTPHPRSRARSRRRTGHPTVLLYSHYDVVGAGDEEAWDSPPFEATERDGAIYGRGAADTKSNILVHVGALRAWGGKPPVGIKLLIEGQEEVGSPLEDPAKLGQFAADALVIADGGNIRPGEPSLTVSIRGDTAHHRRDEDPRRSSAQRQLRRRGPRCTARPPACAGLAARRQRRRRRVRAPARGVEGRRRGGGRVQGVGRRSSRAFP